MENVNFGIHEVVDLRELSNFKVACLAQAKQRLEEVKNPDLEALVEESILQGNRTVSEMKEILNMAATQMNQ